MSGQFGKALVCHTNAFLSYKFVFVRDVKCEEKLMRKQ